MDMLQITIKTDTQSISAYLDNTPSGRDFYAQLPLTLTLTDYHNTEKISMLDTRIHKGQAPQGIKPEMGDITYYAPWGNLAIFYKDFSYSNGLIKLGKITSNINALMDKEPFEVTITAQ